MQTSQKERCHSQIGGVKPNYKLLVDPQLKKGQEKLTRYNGETYSCANHGQGAVVVRDPRPRVSMLWARREKINLSVPRYKVDDWYVGAVPPREVTFSKLNDNVTKQFMEQICEKFGKLERVKVYLHPKTDKHMGLAKVVFSSIKSAAKCIEALHHTSIMGNVINAEIDCKGEVLKRLHHKIIKGEMIADTMPDVIKHTQEKPQPRKSRRKSSQDDPRRRSTDSLADHTLSLDRHSTHGHGPKTPPMKMPSSLLENSQDSLVDFVSERGKKKESSVSKMTPSTASQKPHLSIHEQEPAHSNVQHPNDPPLHTLITENHLGQDVSAQFKRLPSGIDLTNSHSMESGYSSHPGSASLVPEQSSPFHNAFTVTGSPGYSLSKTDKFKQKDKSKLVNKKITEEGHSKSKTTPVSSKDLKNKIESLLTKQNQKYNLIDSNSQIKNEKTLLNRRHSQSSQSGSLEFNSKKSFGSHHPVINKQQMSLNTKSKSENTHEDLEDGECSGEDQSDQGLDSLPTEDEVVNKPVEVVAGSESSERSIVSPSPRPSFSESSHQRFSGSPSPLSHFPPDRSPPPVQNRHLPDDRHGFEPGIDPHRRFPPNPGEFYHPPNVFPHDRFRPPSPGRRSPVFMDSHFSQHRFDPQRPRSPKFERRRRPSPFDSRIPHPRSPVYEHHRHPHSPGRSRHLSPGRTRLPSPGFMRHRDFPPGYHDFNRRRSPSPGFERHKRAISPRRFAGPSIRREFDNSPPRDRLYYNSPPDMDRRRREISPRFSEIDQRQRLSPRFRHDHHRPANAPNSPGSRRKQRDHRELPLEFRERWARIRSPSSGPHGPSRYHEKSPHLRHTLNKEGPPQRQSLSSSPETLHNTPPRIRSPAHLLSDQRPYSPGDLPVEDTAISEDVGPPHLTSLPIDYKESDSGIGKAARRKQRESSDHDVPQISLDERLREITGESPPEPDSPLPSPEKEDLREDIVKNGSEDIQEDMEISSGENSESEGQPPLPSQTKPPQPVDDFRFRNGLFHPLYPGPHHQQWQYGAPRPDMWNGFGPRFHMHNQGQMWCRPGMEHPRFPTNMHNGFPPRGQFHPEHNRMERMLFDPQMLPPPPPGWERPWVHGEYHFPLAPPSVPGCQGNGPGDQERTPADPHKNLSNSVLHQISKDLKETIRRDLNRKVIETMAFKVYESWWDEQHAPKTPKPVKPLASSAVVTIKTEPGVDTEKLESAKVEGKPPAPAGKMPALLNTFDPLNWAKGSLEMDGFRIGLGFRSAISKMPSFRVKKRTPSPIPVPEKKAKLDEAYLQKAKDDKEKRGKDVSGGRTRIWLDSEGEEEDESYQESSDEEDDGKDGKSQVLDVDDVFSSSSSGSDDDDEEETTDEEEEEESDDEEDENIKKSSAKVSGSTLHSISERQLNDDEEVEPPKKRMKVLGNLNTDEDATKKDDEMRNEAATQAAMSLSNLNKSPVVSIPMLSPVLAAAGTSELTQKQLQHVHPKMRYRLLSKDETRNLDLIAEVSGRLRSDDEVSSMSDKEKKALEILADMKRTPERRLSSATRFSESSEGGEMASHSTAPSNDGMFARSAANAAGLKTEKSYPPTAGASESSETVDVSRTIHEQKKSIDKERQAVEALLSIRETQAPIPPLSPLASTMKKDEQHSLHETRKPSRVLTQEDRDKMAALGEEHNYFALSPSRERKVHDSSLIATVLQIQEEHSYSCHPSQAPKSLLQRSAELYGNVQATVFDSDVLSPPDRAAASAAERVKLRRGVKKTSKRRKPLVERDLNTTQRRKPSYPEYKPRSEMEEMTILSLMWMTGLDLEDMRFLRYEYEKMLTQSSVPEWANDTHWVAHPITNVPSPDCDSLTGSPVKRRKGRRRKKDDQANIAPHKSGCARTEGYYKVADKTKQIQRRLMYRQADNTEQSGSKHAAATSSNNLGVVATEKSREARHLMRRIASEFGADASDLLKYNQLMFRKKSVKFKRSRIHGWGLFAQETIGADEMVIEYVGELVRSLVADRREVDYTKRGIGSSYLFRIDLDHIIDATKCGNYARFMNHSCNPSCYAKVITVEGAKKIVIYSKDVIKPSDEITYDYKFPLEDVKIPCYCGAPNCRGTLN